MDEGELRLALIDYLTVDEECPHGMVLLVDEAHTLPLRLLNELRMLTNVVRDGRPAVRLVLAGSGTLEERFASPKLDSFSQRLVGRCFLEAFNRTETERYIRVQIGLARGEDVARLLDDETGVPEPSDEGTQQGGNPFSADACQSVYQATGGVPRLINQLCDHVLMLTYVAGRQQIASADVDEAWADLQQLPMPWKAEDRDDGDSNGVIEFGGLDDQPEDTDRMGDEEPAASSLRISPTTDEGEPEFVELGVLEQDVLEPDVLEQGAVEPAEQLIQIEHLLSDAEEEFRPIGSIGPEVELVFEDPFEEPFEREEVVADRYGRPTGAQPEEPLLRTALATESHEAAKDIEAVQPTQDRPMQDRPMQDRAVAGKLGVEPQQTAQSDDGIVATCPIIAVRRHEFGQLFAKLQRG